MRLPSLTQLPPPGSHRHTASHCQCSSLPSTSTESRAPSRERYSYIAASALQQPSMRTVISRQCHPHHSARGGRLAQLKSRGRLVVAQAKREEPPPEEEGLPEGDDDIFGPAADDLALDGEEDPQEDMFAGADEDEEGFDDQSPGLEEEEEDDDEAEELYVDDEEEDEGLEVEEEAVEGEGEGEEEMEEKDNLIEDISFKEFVKRGKQRPFSAVSAEVVEATEEEIRAVIPQDDDKGMIIPEGAQMALNRQGYQAFQMGALEFLVSETPDGKLDLQDCYIFDGGPEIYTRPEVAGTLPELPIMLQVIPWIERRSGDVLKQKEPYAQMKKVYFVGVQSLQPYRVALDQVFKFEAASRLLSKETVRIVGTPQDPILRIRADGITIEDSGQIPTPSQMLQQGDIQQQEETEEQRLERIREVEERAEELEKLEEQPDVSSADMF